ncbi:MAG: aminotransferase class IV [Tissierellia bacterium]|nr:aminotransferase class IV [Tissierellia bacterium]
MKAEAIEKFYLVNGELKSTGDLKIFNKINKPIYEVIRIIDGVPLFLEEHLERMRESASLLDYKINKTNSEIKKDIKRLILENQIKNLNVKLICTDVEGMGQVFLSFFIKSFYPPEEYYKKGVHTTLFHYERQNPNVKVQISAFNMEVAKRLKEKKVFEALLVSKAGYILEGSRSNIFFVKGDKLYTAPKEAVLLGITRKHIFQVCEELGIKIIEENIHVGDLDKLDGAFMTGTSVNVLPISTIDHIYLDSVNNKMVKEINNAYVNKVMKYIKSKKTEWHK